MCIKYKNKYTHRFYNVVYNHFMYNVMFIYARTNTSSLHISTKNLLLIKVKLIFKKRLKDTKEMIKRHKLKDRKYNDNDLKNTTQKTND